MMKYLTMDLLRTAFWLAVAGLGMTYFLAIDNKWSSSVLVKVGSFTSLMWMFLWIGNALVSDWLDQKVSWKDSPTTRFFWGVVGMIVYTLGAVYFLVYFYKWVLKFNVGDDLNGMLYSTVIITTIITMFMTGRSFLFNWKQAAVDSEMMKKETVKAQYESLKSQVNPHFLFNSLNALTNLVYQDQDKAAKFIKQLSEVYRYVLDTREKR